jgi:predicted metal-dependent RNase
MVFHPRRSDQFWDGASVCGAPECGRYDPAGSRILPGSLRQLYDYSPLRWDSESPICRFTAWAKISNLDQIYRDTGIDSQRETSINAFLIDTGEKRILIDAGVGTLFGACCGRLPETLSAAGYSVDQIDVVLLTHVHADHSGGLMRNNKRVFPNADVYLARKELDYWMSDAEKAKAPPSHQSMFIQGRAALAP